MPDLYLSASGARVTAANVSTPYYGAAVADVTLAEGVTLTNPVELVIANHTQRMAVVRQRSFAGTTTARLVAGAGGWGKAVPAAAYQFADGVPLSMILRDVAAEVGETVRLAADRSVGGWYAREAGPAQRVLRQLVGELWWIDAAGVTQVGPRPTRAVRSDASVTALDGAKGWLEVATEDVAAWQPGATFSGPTVPEGLTVAAVRIASEASGTLRLYVLTLDGLLSAELGSPTPADRTLAAFRALVRAEDPGRVAQGIWEYQVERADGETFDGSPTSADFPLPPLVRVPYRGALAGATCEPTRGTLAYVAFANADPTRPLVVAFGPTLPGNTTVDATGAVRVGASASEIAAGAGAAPVVRSGDTVSIVGVGSGVLTVTAGTAQTPPAVSRLLG